MVRDKDYKKLDISKYVEKSFKNSNEKADVDEEKSCKCEENKNLFQKTLFFLKNKNVRNFILFIISLFISLIIGIFIGYSIKKRVFILTPSQSLKLKNISLQQDLFLGYAPTPTKHEIDGKGMVIVDRRNGAKIAYWNDDFQLPIASLTKLVSAYISVKYWDVDQYLTVTQEVDPNLESSAGLKKGESYKVKDLISALLIKSANEAGYTLADHYPGGRKMFVDKMNEFVSLLGLQKTYFFDPVGVDEGNVSTPYELSLITRVVLQNETIREIVGKKNLEIEEKSGRKVELKSTNELLSSPYFFGVKTGLTLKAGPCFVGWYKDPKNDMIIVLLNVSNRFETARMLADRFKRG